MKTEKPIRLLAMDLDETLLGSDKHVSKENREALAKARAAGIHTVIATGRPWFSFRQTLQEIGTDNLEDEYSISLNGGAIVANSSGDPVYVKGLPYERIAELFEKGRKYPAAVHVNTLDQAYGWNLSEDERAFLKGRLPIIELEAPDLQPYQKETFVKILFGSLDPNILHSIKEDLGKDADDLDVSFSSGRYVEFNARGVTKGSGLKALADLLGLDLLECAAIGDHMNDLAMIEEAGLGIAVANAVDPIKEVADYITAADHNHGAIAEAVGYILQRNRRLSQSDSSVEQV